MKLSKKQPGEKGYKKTLDDLQLSLDFPPNEAPQSMAYYSPINRKVLLPSIEACPKGHFLKTSGGDCIFCKNWLNQIKKGYSGVPNKMGPYKRQDIGADYGGSGNLG